MLDARLDFGRSVLEVEWDPSRVPLSAVARRLDGLGYAPHPARGGRAREQRRKEERAEVLATFHNILKGEPISKALRHRIRWPDGSLHWLEITGSLQREADGRPRMFGVIRDISAQQDA